MDFFKLLGDIKTYGLITSNNNRLVINFSKSLFDHVSSLHGIGSSDLYRYLLKNRHYISSGL